MTESPVLLVSADAAEFASRLSIGVVTVCTSADQAMAAYEGHPVLFGDPNLVAEVLPQMPAVRWVQSTWAGVKPLIDLGRRDYALTGVKGVFGTQMAEFVVGYLLAHELKLFERQVQQREHRWFDAGNGTLAGKQLGIMGAGSIGRDIAGRAAAFGVNVRGLNRSGKPVDGFHSVCAQGELPKFLDGLDYLVSVLPQTPATDKLLNADTLALLPKHAYFINVGRGNVVEDAALMDALENRRLAGVVLDVFDEEPLPTDSPLWDTKNLLITAHISALSHPDLIVPLFEENYRRYVAGEPLKHVVDFDAGY